MRNPWVGLRPFSTRDSELFFGRVKERRIIANLVATLPVLIVYAPSGTGKSSLINAGLAPEWETDPAQVAVFVQPHGDVLAETGAGLRAAGWDAPHDLELDELLARHWAATERRAIIVIDQLEERFNAGVPSDDLFAAMAKMAHGASDAACIVLSIREDYLGNLEPLMRRVPSLLNASYRVPPLTHRALEAAVYGPVEWTREQRDGDISVDPDLVARSLEDLRSRSTGRQEPGEQRFEPGYFQIVWSTLWESRSTDAGSGGRITLRDYQRLGGADQILTDFTAKILDSMEPAHTQLFWAISRYLVLPTGAKVGLTVTDLTELLQPSDYMTVTMSVTADYGVSRAHGGAKWLADLDQARTKALINAVLAGLTRSDAPLFQRVVRSGREEFELLHDLLGTILLAWRENYRTKITEEVKRGLESLERTTRQDIAAQGRRSLTPVASKDRSARATAAFEGAARTFCKRLSSSSSPAETLALGEEARRLLADLFAVQTLQREAGYDYDVEKRLDASKHAVAQHVTAKALDDPSPKVRRVFQELVPYWTGRSGMGVYLPTPKKVTAVRIAGASALSATSATGAYLLFRGLTDDLNVDLTWLTLVHVCLVFVFTYFIAIEDSKKPTTWRRIADIALLPERAKGRTRLLLGPLAWPLPLVIVTGLATLTAWGFEAIGWDSTAGFNIGAAWFGVAIAAALISAGERP